MNLVPLARLKEKRDLVLSHGNLDFAPRPVQIVAAEDLAILDELIAWREAAAAIKPDFSQGARP